MIPRVSSAPLCSTCSANAFLQPAQLNRIVRRNYAAPSERSTNTAATTGGSNNVAVIVGAIAIAGGAYYYCQFDIF